MKIYINNELIDIKLEKEKTFHDLFMSMQEEAQNIINLLLTLSLI
jgi:hypothetical protein